MAKNFLDTAGLTHYHEKVKALIEASGSGIVELTSPITIWNLEAGIYKLPANCYVYFKGTSTSTYFAISSTSYLFVSDYSTTYKSFFAFCSNATTRYIYNGYSTSSTGAYKSFNIGSTYLTNISSYVKDNLTQSTSSTSYALSAYQGYLLDQNKQDKLVSGTNIKTINGEDILGEGNITIESGSGGDCTVKVLEGTETAPIYLRELQTGAYKLNGVCKPYNGSDTSMTANNSIAFVTHFDTVTAIQIFYPPYNQVQYFEVYDDNYTSNVVALNDLASKVTTLENNGIRELTENFNVWELETGLYYVAPNVTITNYTTFYSSLTSAGVVESESQATTTVQIQKALLFVQATESNGMILANYQLSMMNEAPMVVSGMTYYASGTAMGGTVTGGDFMVFKKFLNYQEKLVSGTNIKTINGTSLLGSGDITIEGGSSVTPTAYNVTGSSTSVATATTKTIATLTVPAGMYMFYGFVNFGSNSTGVRKIYIGTSADTYANTRGIADTRSASNNSSTMSNISTVLNPSAETTYYLNVYQNSGSTLTCYGSLRAVRIGDYAEYQSGL